MYFEKDDNKKSMKYKTAYQNTGYLTQYYKNMKFQRSGLGKQYNLDPKHDCDRVSSNIKINKEIPTDFNKAEAGP